MNEHFRRVALEATGATNIHEMETIQNLWSGYGRIIRCGLEGASRKSVVVKHVHWPDHGAHPRGWNTNLSHERKVRSYQVETQWYSKWAARCDAACRVPECLAFETHGDEVFMVLEDLDASGFPLRRNRVTPQDIEACLSWLAHFHAVFMDEKPDGLWPVGTYWHLETRPEELAALSDAALKAAASAIDRRLNECGYQTFVHGDAKLANFCFAPDGRVAAVDFQYIGGGCGMKDVAYFISSCLYEEECERQESRLLDFYFGELKAALKQYDRPFDADAIEAEWRALYPVAWTDFYRFLQGWSPGHWKIHGYSERLAREVLEQL